MAQIAQIIMDSAQSVMDIFRASDAPKKSDALRIGLLGASNIAPSAIIGPAKSHTEVIIAGVAARDEVKARRYAKIHGIPIVHKRYQDLLDDPVIDAIYIALPNSLHAEWSLKALKAGKHVLLEKPSTSNAAEASALFNNELLRKPNAPVLLEALHSSFHPAWQTFLSLLVPEEITFANSTFNVFAYFFPLDDIRYNYELSGGALMDLGAYTVYFLRSMMAAEPKECIEATARRLPQGYDQNIDQAFEIKWRFPNGAMGEASVDLGKRGGYWFPWLTKSWPSLNIPKCYAIHRETIVSDATLPKEQEHSTVRKVSMLNPLLPHFWHRIDIETTHIIRHKTSQKTIKTWKDIESKKAYTWPKERNLPGDAAWSTYRWMLEEFVNKIKRREGAGTWFDGEDSIKQMAMIDSAYEKSDLPLRPTHNFE